MGRVNMRRNALGVIAAAALLLMTGAFVMAHPGLATDSRPRVYVAKVNGTIEQGLARYVNRVFDTAEREKAAAVIVEVSTPGGRVDSAIAIKDRIMRSPVTTIAHVRDHAWSAGALVTLSAEKIAMAPGSSIGSAEPRPLDEKVLSAWRAELESTAERRGRNPSIAAGMADTEIVIPGVKEKGKLLNLTWTRALELGISDATAADREEVLAAFGPQNAMVVEATQSAAEVLARFVSNPVVAPIILRPSLPVSGCRGSWGFRRSRCTSEVSWRLGRLGGRSPACSCLVRCCSPSKHVCRDSGCSASAGSPA
jgi:membrane-bound serine protease (ClpP class)